MECSYHLFPKTDSLKQLLQIPCVLAVSPSDPSLTTRLNVRPESLITCRSCNSYLTSHSPISGDKWECSICAAINRISDHDISQQQFASSQFEVILNSEQSIGPLFAIYLSLGFSIESFSVVKSQVSAFLDFLDPHSKCLIFIGTDRAPFAVLVPPIQSIPVLPTTKSFQLLHPKLISRYPEIPSIVRFASIESFIGLDLGNFFFTAETFSLAKQGISKLSPGNDSQGFMRCLPLFGTISRALEGLPLRGIAFVHEIYGDLEILEMARRLPLRTDFLVWNLNKKANEIAKVLQGSLTLISSIHYREQARFLARQKTVYQLFGRCRSWRSAAVWKKSYKPFNDPHEQNIFVPVCITDHQAFALEVNTLPNQEFFIFQITAKFVKSQESVTETYLRVMSLRIPTSDSFEQIVRNVQWNCVLWFWSRRTFDKPKEVAVNEILSVASKIVKQCGDAIDPNFVRAISAVPDWLLVSDSLAERSIATDVISFSSPLHQHFLPHLSDNGKICLSLNGIEGNTENCDLDSLMNDFPIFMPVNPIITPSFLEPTEP
jgi:hypothetical protein